MRKRQKLLPLFLSILIFLSVSAVSHAQVMLIPRNVYVGDPATLILSMPGSSQNMEDVIISAHSPLLPSDINIDFHRIVLERRIGGSRLIIEFTAFVPGLLELPVIVIGGEHFAGIVVTINSVINAGSSAQELSQPASSLAMPGTAIMLYGIVTGFILAVLFSIWVFLKGRVFLQYWLVKWKHWRLIVSIKNTEKRLHRLLLKGGGNRFILDELSQELRMFLSSYTGDNCRAMTAFDFEKLPIDWVPPVNLNGEFSIKHQPIDVPTDGFSGITPKVFNGIILGDFFRRCDKLRFCGTDVNEDDVTPLLADLRIFIGELQSGTPYSGILEGVKSE